MSDYDNLRSFNFSSTHLHQIEVIKEFTSDDWTGIITVVIIFGLWFASLFTLLSVPILDIPWFWLAVAVGGRTFLHTGLFILAHDAMHGNLIPSDRNLNNIIGRLAVGIYALLPYDRCSLNHAKHHRYPSQVGDPDFHNGFSHPIFWYCKFLREYFSGRSLVIFLSTAIALFTTLILLCKVSLINLVLFWLFPLVLSSSQLFIFGTYLPHRQVYQNPNFSPRLEVNWLSLIWAFLSCYNFGHYHWEHHEYPQTPWYRLPTIHRL